MRLAEVYEGLLMRAALLLFMEVHRHLGDKGRSDREGSLYSFSSKT